MASFGETLKRERELREMTLREISDATKVNIRYLEALEQNSFEILPGGLFNKGFIRAYATYVGLDCEEMVHAYLDEIALHDAGPVEETDPTHSGVHRPAVAPRRRLVQEPETPPLVHGAQGHREHGDASPSLQQTDPHATDGAVPSAGDDGRSGLDRSTRVLASVFGLIAGISLLFVALSFFMPRDSSRPARAELESITASPQPLESTDGTKIPAGPPAMERDRETGETTARVAALAGAVQTVDHSAATDAPEGGGVQDREGPSRPSDRPAGTAGDAPPAEPLPTTTPAAALVEESGAMSVRLKTRGRTWVQLFCDGDEAINWVMRSGDQEEMECRESIRVSATDASAIRLSVNGAKCMPLGESGQRVYGYTLRIDDYHLACGRRRRGANGR